MADIYRRAMRVVAWTGIEAPGSERALGLMGNLAHLFEILAFDTLAEAMADDELTRASRKKARADATAMLEESRSEDTYSWSALSQFFDRPYWRRAWVMQEITVAKETVVQCGQQTTDWIIVAKAIQSWNLAMKADRSNDSSLLGIYASVNALRAFHKNAHAHKPLLLLDALNQS